jgi:hypothetical protein
LGQFYSTIIYTRKREENMTGNLGISKSDNNLTKEKVREHVIVLIMVIPVMLAFSIVLEKFLPARKNYSDSHMEELCASKVLYSMQDPIPIANASDQLKCVPYYSLKYLANNILFK